MEEQLSFDKTAGLRDSIITAPEQNPLINVLEAVKKFPDTNDIYSMGELLFNKAIAGGNDEYCSEYYDNIRNLVTEAPLIKASEDNSHPKARNALIEILQKSLASNPSERFQSDKEILNKIDVLIKMLQNSNLKNDKINSPFVFEYQLFTHPIYKYHKGGVIHVLIIGLGGYGSSFADLCLQVGQIPDYRLKITVLSDNAEEDGKLYLADRPALKDFFYIGRHEKAPDSDDCYGSIYFENESFSVNDKLHNEKILRSVQEIYPDICYTFIATGNDCLNAVLAEEILTLSGGETDMKQYLCYVQEVRKARTTEIKGASPLYVNEDMSHSPLYSDIERMAFNAHLLWEKDLNLDFDNAWHNFEEKYYYNSNIRLVLAMKSKLFSMGIELDEQNYAEAASEIFRRLEQNENKKEMAELKSKLIWAEHKRWVTEKLVDGWVRLDLSERPLGDTKIKKKKKHICIVKSRPDLKLHNLAQDKDKPTKWNYIKDNVYQSFDDLDKLSVDLHTDCAKKAEKEKNNYLRETNILSDKENNNMCESNIFSDMEKNLRDSEHSLSSDQALENTKKALNALLEFKACIDNILNGSRNSLKLYGSYKNTFLKAAEKTVLVNDAEKKIKEFDEHFLSVRESLDYIDFKDNDAVLVERIPFILTYSSDIRLAVPFSDANNTEIFRNIASASIINPAEITYIYYTDSPCISEKFCSALSNVLSYADKRNIRSALDFIIFCKASDENNRLLIADKLRKLCGERKITDIKIFGINSIAEVENILCETLSKKNIALEKNETGLSYFLMGAGIYDKYPSYTFELNSSKFITDKRCEYLSYVKSAQYLKIDEMIAFNRSDSVTLEYPGHCNDFRPLWNCYKNNKKVWFDICAAVRNAYEKEEKENTAFFNASAEETEKIYSYTISNQARRAASKIINGLQSYGVARSGSQIKNLDETSSTVIIKSSADARYEAAFNKIFKNGSRFLHPDDELRIYKADKIYVNHIGLKAVLTDLKDPKAAIKLITDLKRDTNICIIKDFKVNKDSCIITVTFNSKLDRELFTIEGKMLELAVYHMLRSSGVFSDVVGSCKLNWLSTDIENEFDCIVTDGFRSFFIECKAKTELEQNYFFKLSCLAEQFGINVQPIMVVHSDSDAEINELNIKRGKMLKGMSVITVTDKEEINNFAVTLRKIIKGEYPGSKHENKSKNAQI